MHFSKSNKRCSIIMKTEWEIWFNLNRSMENYLIKVKMKDWQHPKYYRSSTSNIFWDNSKITIFGTSFPHKSNRCTWDFLSNRNFSMKSDRNKRFNSNKRHWCSLKFWAINKISTQFYCKAKEKLRMKKITGDFLMMQTMPSYLINREFQIYHQVSKLLI